MNNSFIHPTVIIDQPCQIGPGTSVWCFTHICKGAVIGKNCNIGQNVYIGRDVHVGNGVKIQNNVSVYEQVTLEDFVFCGPSVVFTNVLMPRSEHPVHGQFMPTCVGRGATLGANSTIICGIDIGEYAMVGAGSVVTRNVLPYSLVMGNPARHRGWVGIRGEKLRFDEEGLCISGDEAYELRSGQVIRKTKS